MTDSNGVVCAPTALQKKRATVVLFAFLLWGLLVVARLGQFMIVERGRYLRDMARESLFEGTVPALRGRIIDRDGHPLAWSTRHFELHWVLPPDAGEARARWSVIRDGVPALRGSPAETLPGEPGEAVVLCADVPAGDIAAVRSLCSSVPNLAMRSRFRRHTASGPVGLAAMLGTVEMRGGAEVGVDGLERVHDALLRGRAGRYRVMLDRRGRWVPGTLEEIVTMRPGYDVHVRIRGTAGGEGAP